MSDQLRPYVINSDGECERLERQAALAGLEEHLAYIPVALSPKRILDAGCGSGSMARLLAARCPKADVVGVDIRPDYVAYARERAQSEGLSNLSFEVGDILRLPFPDGSFELVWSKYVLQWVKDPAAAMAEMRRVAAPGGRVVCCHFDGFAVTHWPEVPELQAGANRVFSPFVDPFIGRKMASLMRQVGLADVAVHFEPDRLYTVVSQIDPERRRNWIDQFTAARPHMARILGGEAEADTFIEAFLTYQDNPDTASYTALYFASGTVPGEHAM